MVRKQIVMKYYLHYDKQTGRITAVSNEATLKDEGSYEVPFEEYKSFMEGEKLTKDYIIGYTKGIDGKTKKSLIQTSEQLYGFRTNMFEWIDKPPTRSTELIAQWNKSDQTWSFSLSNKAKLRLANEPKGKTVFFVMLKDDFDFLIRDIVLEVEDLIKEDITVPFDSGLENDISKISLSSKIYFQSYGLIINDKN